MRQGNEQGISINIRQPESTSKESILEALSLFLISAILFIGIDGVIWTALGFSALPVSGFALAAAGIFVCAAGAVVGRVRKINILFVVFLLCIGILIVFIPNVRNGLIVFINMALDVLSLKFERIFLSYFANADAGGVQIFALCAVILTAALSVYLVRKANIIAIIILALCILSGCAVGLLSADVFLTILIFGVALLILRTVTLKNTIPDRRGIMFPVLLLLFVVSAAMLVSLFASGARQHWDFRAAKAAAGEYVQGVRYGKISGGMPEGRLKNLQGLRLSSNIMMEVTMTKPDSLYLRGFVGEVYQNNKWDGLPSKTLHEAAGLFYWLHKNGFNPNVQISRLASALDKKDTDNAIEVSVKNVSANRKYIYAPYELLDSNHILDKGTVDDRNIRTKGIWGQSRYTYTTLPNQVKQYPLLQARLKNSQNKADTDAIAYLSDENAYREFIYKNDTAIPENIKKLFDSHLADYQWKHISRSEVKQIILSYLTQNLTYSEGAVTNCGDEDFLKFLFEKSGMGYSVHYATAATLMFRYFGVPARYVEGYLITPDEVRGLNENAVIKVKGLNAHSWTEIYEDGVGWIPFEPTPAYVGMMEQAERKGGAASENGSDVGIGMSPGDADSAAGLAGNDEQGALDSGGRNMTQPHIWDIEEPAPNEPSIPKPDAPKFDWLPLAIAVLLLILICVPLIRLIRKHRALHSLKKAFDTVDNAHAIRNMFAYTAKFLLLSGLEAKNCSISERKDELLELYDDEKTRLLMAAAQINCEAMFSDHEMSEEQRSYTKELMRRTIKDYLTSLNPIMRFYTKWIECNY